MISADSKCLGKWKVSCGNNFQLSVQKLDENLTGISYIYEVGNDSFNRNWFLDDNLSVKESDFNQIQWPSFLQPEEHIIIEVLPSGNYIISDD